MVKDCVSTSVNSAFTYVLNQVVEPASNGKQFLDLRATSPEQNEIAFVTSDGRHPPKFLRDRLFTTSLQVPRENLVAKYRGPSSF